MMQRDAPRGIEVGDRVDLAESMIDGLSVGELSAKSKPADEIKQLCSYVNSLLRKD
jgi:hypothetical protein